MNMIEQPWVAWDIHGRCIPLVGFCPRDGRDVTTKMYPDHGYLIPYTRGYARIAMDIREPQG